MQFIYSVKILAKLFDIRAWCEEFEGFYQSPWRNWASLGGGCGNKNT